MKIRSATFHSSARDLASCPNWDLREFAFIGRSNVGKSSMINMLTNRDGLAKVSATPGKTRLINLYVINETWSLVDLPGYGYAKAAKAEKEQFLQAVADYLAHRPQLARVFVLIDSRLPPQKIDIDFIEWTASHGLPFALVFTKADKQSAARTKAATAAFYQAIPALENLQPPVFTTSSKDGSGRGELLRFIQES